jgi:hypothetical protein
MIDYRHVAVVWKVGVVILLIMLLNACSQTPAPVASKPKQAAVPFRSADAPAPFIHPVPTGRISSSFANYVVKSRNRKHHGVDFAAPIGTPVYAASSGVVLNADMGSMSDAFGLAVLIEHGDKFQSLSAHLSRIDVQIGDWVEAGQQIGLVGKTGRATGAHLHFELWQNSIPKDPLLFLPIKAPYRPIAAEPLVPAGAPTFIAKQAKATKKTTAKKQVHTTKSKKTVATKVASKHSVKTKTAKKSAAKTATANKQVVGQKGKTTKVAKTKVAKTTAKITEKTTLHSKTTVQLAQNNKSTNAASKSTTTPQVKPNTPLETPRVTDKANTTKQPGVAGASQPQPIL